MIHSLRVAALAAVVVAGLAPAQQPKPVTPTPGPAIQPAKPIDPEAPRISCATPVYDFGEAAQNDKVEFEYELVNVGKRQLEIIKVHPTCSCTVAEPDKKFLAQGEKTKVKITFNTLNFNGPITKQINVESNDPAQPHLMLTLQGKVQAAFRASVQELTLGTLRKGTAFPEQTFDVFTAGSSKSVITDVSSDNAQIKATFAPLPEKSVSRGYRITARIEGQLPVGPLRSTLTITTDLNSQRQITVPVSALVEGEVGIRPRTFNFGKVKKGETAEKVVEIDKAGDANLKIEGLELKPDGPFKAALETAQDGRAYRVKISLAADAKEGYQRGTLTIKTNCPGETSLSVYFYAFVTAN